MIGRLQDPTAGRVFLGGEDVTHVPPYRRDVNTVFQSYALFPHLTVEKNCRLRAAAAQGRPRRGAPPRGGGARAGAAAGPGPPPTRPAVPACAAAARRPRARAREPALRAAARRSCGALDLRPRKQLQIELSRIQRDVGVTFIHVTHDQEEAMSMADRIAVMNEGRIEQLGSATELYEQPRTEFVANFLGVEPASTAASCDATALWATSTPTGPGCACPSRAWQRGRHGRHAGGRAPGEDLAPRDRRAAARAGAWAPAQHPARPRDRRQLPGTSTSYVVRTDGGADVTVYAQNAGGSALETLGPGREVVLAWEPPHTFVVPKDRRLRTAARHPQPHRRGRLT